MRSNSLHYGSLLRLLIRYDEAIKIAGLHCARNCRNLKSIRARCRWSDQLRLLDAALPVTCRTVGGVTAESGKEKIGSRRKFPMMRVAIATLLTMPLQIIGCTALVRLAIPIDLIGMASDLVVFSVPFGFVARLGVIARSAMILRNSVILVDQIEQDEKDGKRVPETIVGSTVHGFRPRLSRFGQRIPDPERFLGADGSGYLADHALPAGALRRLVSRQGIILRYRTNEY
jgi:hypothetical protein